MTIEFVDELPSLDYPRVGPKSVYGPMLESLKTRPGTWAILRNLETNKKATSLQANLRKAYGPLGYEFSARYGSVYGRYVGDES